MEESQISALSERVCSMSQAERERLDPICEALRVYQDVSPPDRGHILPNRIAALAAVDVMQDWEKSEWERE